MLKKINTFLLEVNLTFKKTPKYKRCSKSMEYSKISLAYFKYNPNIYKKWVIFRIAFNHTYYGRPINKILTND